MTECSVFGSRATAEASVVEPSVQTIRTEGYHAAGDGGGAYYNRVAKKPLHAGHLVMADASCWEITGCDFSARQFGARGDGIADDTETLQAALDCPMVGSLLIPAGRYRANNLRLRRSCTLIGQAAELFCDDPEAEGDLINIIAPDVHIRSLSFSGVRYADFYSKVGPHCLLRIDPQPPEDTGEVRIQDCSFTGGVMGCIVGLVSNVFIDRVRFERCYRYALVLARGPRRIIINGLIAHEIGQYGALKTGLVGTARATEQLVVNDFVITDCGRIEPDTSMWQEGIDLIAGFAREFVVSNGVISNCGNGGIELKTASEVFIEEEDVYQDILITGVIISVTGNFHGIVLHWHGPKTNRDKRGRRTMICNNVVRHKDATAAAATGIHVSAWSDLHLVDNFIEGAHHGIVLSPEGSTDDTASRVRIAGNRVVGVDVGISCRHGNIEALDISGNVMDCARAGVLLGGARCRGVEISHNRIRQVGNSKYVTACIEVRNALDVEIWNNKLNSKHGCGVYVPEDKPGPTSGYVLKNVVTAGRESFQLRNGDWQVFDNFIRADANRPTLGTGKRANVMAAWNIRGLRNVRPKDDGSPGDVALHGKRPMVLSTSPLGWWADMSDPQGQGAWTEISAPNDGQEPVARAKPRKPAAAVKPTKTLPSVAALKALGPLALQKPRAPVGPMQSLTALRSPAEAATWVRQHVKLLKKSIKRRLRS